MNDEQKEPSLTSLPHSTFPIQVKSPKAMNDERKEPSLTSLPHSTFPIQVKSPKAMNDERKEPETAPGTREMPRTEVAGEQHLFIQVKGKGRVRGELGAIYGLDHPNPRNPQPPPHPLPFQSNPIHTLTHTPDRKSVV